nr:phage tail assembly chaperone [Polymorphobacter sp.]
MTFASAATTAARVAAVLGWSPATFWAATPADLRAALGLDLEPPAAAAPDLARLMEAFPDGPTAR